MIKFLISILAMLAFSASAMDLSIEAGFRQQSGDAGDGTSTSSQMGYQVGGAISFPVYKALHLRSGMYYTQRPLNVTLTSSGNSEVKYNMTYFDVPVAAMYKFEDYGSVYAGMMITVNLDHTCSGVSGCTVTNNNSMLYPFILGATFKFAPQMGGNIYFENAGEASRDLKAMKAVGANFAFYFE